MFLMHCINVDFLGMFCCPLLLVALLHQQWILGWATCFAFTVVTSASINTSIMTLFLVSLDRLMAVIRPFEHRAQDTFTQRRTSFLIVTGWIHSLFWAVMPIFGWGEIVSEPNTYTCKPNWSANGFKNRTYSLGLGIFCFAAPVITIVVVYIFIYRRSKMKDGMLQEATSLQTKVRQEQQRKILMTVLMIIGTFCCCWLLYTIVTTWKFVSHHAPPNWLVQLGLIFALSNSCANPIIYAVRDRRLGTGYARLFDCCLGNNGGNFRGDLVSKYFNTERQNTTLTRFSRTDLQSSKSSLDKFKLGIVRSQKFSTLRTPLNAIDDKTEFHLSWFDISSTNVDESPESAL